MKIWKLWSSFEKQIPSKCNTPIINPVLSVRKVQQRELLLIVSVLFMFHVLVWWFLGNVVACGDFPCQSWDSHLWKNWGVGGKANNESPQSECFMLAKMCFQGAADKSSYLRQLANFSRCLNWLSFCFKCMKKNQQGRNKFSACLSPASLVLRIL